MSRWSLRRRGTSGHTDGPQARDEPVFAVEEYDGIVLLRMASDDALSAADVDDLARSLPSDDGTVTVVTGADESTAGALWPRLATLLDSLREEDVTSVRLVMSGSGHDRPGHEAPARRIAEAWGMEVIAPDAVVLVVPGGGLFVPGLRPESRDTGSWWRFAPGAEPVALGPRQPAPAWQPGPPGPQPVTASGCVVEQIPAGLLVRPKDALAPRLGDLCYAIPVDRHGPLVLVGVPDGEDVLATDVSEAVDSLPPAARSRVRIAPGGRRDVLEAGRSLAGTLGHEVVVHTGLPLLPTGGLTARHGVRATLADADGTPRWHPYVDAVVCAPAKEPGEAAPAPRLLRWSSPMPGRGRGEQGVLPLSDRWQVTFTRAGLWISGPDGAPVPLAGRPVAADGPMIEVGRPGEPLDMSLWPELSRLLTALGADVCSRARLMVHGTCVDGGRALRGVAGRHNVRSLRFGRLRAPAPAAVSAATQAQAQALVPVPVPAAVRSEAAVPVPVPAAPVPDSAPAPAPSRRIPLAELLEPDTDTDTATDPAPPIAPASGTDGSTPTSAPEAAEPAPSPAAGAVAQATATSGSAPKASAPRTSAPKASAPRTSAPKASSPEPAPVPPAPAPPAPTPPQAGTPAPTPPAPDPAPAAPPARAISTSSSPGPAVSAPTASGAPEVTPVRASAPPLERVPFLPGHSSTDAERAAFRVLAESGWERHGAAVARMLTRMPALRGQEQEAARPDLIAMQLYLRGAEGPLSHTALHLALRTGNERLLPYAACVASGLRRLPAFRGAAVRGAPAGQLPVPGGCLRDAGPVSALPVEGGAPAPGGTRYAIWSVTGRRVRQLFDGPAPDARTDEVVFLPGTVFRVLDVRTDAGSPLILLRELPGAPAPAASGQEPLDDQDRAALARLDASLSGHPAGAGPSSWPDRCSGPVGSHGNGKTG
ncbi:hypothetical protein OG596_19625 [Streptomyces sp. NBC_01102]|uniref:hypothetical protein n=1 Tax=Streptomyces sp. NBC_01102 TaxID=2903749 RepID=UPI003866ABCD|nr:hypothetical protein OG596_19625 [Streptomyces sp. NBC_01102]